MTRHYLRPGLIAWTVSHLIVGSALGKDVFVTLGGGPEATQNQVSLEKNVEFFSRTLEANYPSPLDHRILFADGASPLPDLQYVDESVEISEAVRWMNRILGDDAPLQLRYRNHHPMNGDQPADKEHVRTLLQTLAAELVAGDRLVMYVTAHGSPAALDDPDEGGDVGTADGAVAESDFSDEGFGDGRRRGEREVPSLETLGSEPVETWSAEDRDTSILLWGSDELRVTELTRWLDQFSPEVEIVVVMVQCYSGGFADIVFRKADYRGGLSERPRCGFFSQRHDRAAAGCTADIDESDYQEYSSFFWAALGGQARSTGEVIDADYDGNGSVSFAEAHAYASITSDTIDVPVRTSDVLLRRFSRIEEKTAEAEQRGVVSSLLNRLVGSNDAVDSSVEMRTMESTINELLPIARPDQREVIERLAAVLEIELDSTTHSIHRRLRRLGRSIDSDYDEIAALAPAEQTLIEEIRESLHQAHPEFSKTGYSAVVTEWTSSRADEFVALVESLEESQALRHVTSQLETKLADAEALERYEAKLERLLRTLQNVLYEANLPLVADEATVQRFHALMELESGTLWPER